jgi:hypothetical protein
VQGLCFFAPASEYERIAAFQPHNSLALLREFHEQRADGLLLQWCTATLSDIEALRGRWDKGNHSVADKPVVHNDLGRSKPLRGPHREELGITRPRSDQ